MKKSDKTTQPSGEEQKKVFSGNLNSNNCANFKGSETDSFGDGKILIKVGLSQVQMDEIARLQELGNSGIHLVLFTSSVESCSPENSQKANFNPVEQKVKIDYSLTECEKMVLEGLSKGYSYRKIADDRFRSENTIKRQASDGYRKLDVHNKVDASAKLRDFIKIIILLYLNLELLTEFPWLDFLDNF
jgi:DNA-binding CsgD family transcriptional regulator